MFEFIGLIFGTVFLAGLSCVVGAIFGLIGWLIFWGRRRPKLLILLTMAIPPGAFIYVAVCAVVFSLFVPNQPDEFFGDINEPLPNGYVLKGLAKMPDRSFLDVSNSNRPEPQLRSGIKSLGQDAPMIYGAYGPIDGETLPSDSTEHGYFVFDTRSGVVRNLATVQELNQAVGHPVKLELSENFRSQDPYRIRLRQTETAIYVGPPSAAALFCFFLLVRRRLKAPPIGAVA